MNVTKRVKSSEPSQQIPVTLLKLSNGSFRNALKFLSIHTLFRILCVSSFFNKNVNAILAKIPELPKGLFSRNDQHALQQLYSIRNHCHGLQSLSVGFYSRQREFRHIFRNFALSLHRLTNLYYSNYGKHKTDSFIQQLASISLKLETLHLFLPNNIILPINELQCKNLTSLGINGGYFPSENDLSTFLNRSPSLKELCLVNVRGVSAYDAFANVCVPLNIRKLVMCLPVGIRTVKTIARTMRTLELLRLVHCGFGSECVVEMLKLERLTELFVAGCDLGDFRFGMKKTSLVRLGVQDCSLNDGCIGRILRAFPNLKTINIYQNNELTEYGMGLLSAIEITYTPCFKLLDIKSY